MWNDNKNWTIYMVRLVFGPNLNDPFSVMWTFSIVKQCFRSRKSFTIAWPAWGTILSVGALKCPRRIPRMSKHSSSSSMYIQKSQWERGGEICAGRTKISAFKQKLPTPGEGASGNPLHPTPRKISHVYLWSVHTSCAFPTSFTILITNE